MEKRYLRKKSLKSRILKNIFFVLAVSMIFSTAISYVYFEKIVRKQVLEEERAGLRSGYKSAGIYDRRYSKFCSRSYSR